MLVGIVTVSDSRTLETDESGALAARMLTDAGHRIVGRDVVRDEPEAVRRAVRSLVAAGARVVITSGGTGISPRDNTYEAIASLLEKRLDGFGELFRALSYAEIGPAAMMSRAIAGTCDGVVLVALPGSPDAVRLGLEKLVLPELAHLSSLAAHVAVPRNDRGDERDMMALTHVDERGQARMVDVAHKAQTVREAVAQAVVSMGAESFARLASGSVVKGDVLATARIAGIQAAKRTAELIPLCHPVALSSLTIDLEPDVERSVLRVLATARASDRTGVEMEALVAASVAALTVYDMLKAVDRGIVVGEVMLLRKTGGKRGDYVR